MRKIVIIFTYKYPYEPPREQFLNDELSYWINSGADVVIVPLGRDINKSKAYPNVNLAEVKLINVKRRRKIIECIWGLGAFSSMKDFFHCELKQINCSTRGKERRSLIVSLLRLMIQVESQKKEILEVLNLDDLKQYDRVVFYSYWLNATAVLAEIFKEKLISEGGYNCFAISRAHGDMDLYQKQRYRVGMTAIAKLTKVFAISDHGYRYLKKQGFNNVEVSRLGISKNNVNTNCSSDSFTIVSCSVVNENKRVDKIAEALSCIKQRNIRWVHFGDGPELQGIIDWCNNNMPQNIECCFKGWTKNEEIMNYYDLESPNIFINVSKIEGIPVSLMEAFSHSIPAIATDVGGVAEIVNKKNGVLLDEHFAIEDLVNAINSFLNATEPELLEKQKNAYSTWKSLYNADINYSEFVASIME